MLRDAWVLVVNLYSRPPYLWGIVSKTTSGCLKFQIVPVFFYTYIPMIKIKL